MGNLNWGMAAAGEVGVRGTLEVGHDSIFQKAVWDLTGQEINVCSRSDQQFGDEIE